MSMDTVDDLHYAEDCLGAAAQRLAELGHPGLLDDYCRPTCRAEGGHHHEDDPEQDDFCGCLCHNREPVPTPDPVPLVEVLRDFGEDTP